MRKREVKFGLRSISDVKIYGGPGVDQSGPPRIKFYSVSLGKDP